MLFSNEIVLSVFTFEKSSLPAARKRCTLLFLSLYLYSPVLSVYCLPKSLLVFYLITHAMTPLPQHSGFSSTEIPYKIDVDVFNFILQFIHLCLFILVLEESFHFLFHVPNLVVICIH